jgi:hypothetical protein
VNYSILYLTALSPGKIFRYFERNRQYALPVRSLLLSDGVGNKSLRCLFSDEPFPDTVSPVATMQSLGPALSEVFPPRVTLLWRQAATTEQPDRWGFIVWETGVEVETAEQTLPPEPEPNMLSWLPGMRRRRTPPPDIAWALERGLPIDRLPASGLRRHIPIIDYITVAGLDQRNLLVENSPRLYRFPLDDR